MLSSIREKATGWIAWAIVILITIPFALWGINSYFEGANEIAVATADGVNIDQQTFQNALSERRRTLAQMMGQNLDSDYFSSNAFKIQVLDALIDGVLQSENARDQGYRISDEQLREEIRSLPYFQTDGAFDSERYRAVLASAGYSVQGFEQQQRQDVTIAQLERGLSGTAFVTESEIDQALSLLDQERVAKFVTLSVESFIDRDAVSDDEISAEYEASRDRYFAPEMVMVEYLELSVAALAEEITPAESELKQVYDDNPGRFSEPGLRRASHILVALAADATEEEEADALARAQEILGELSAGGDFGELAGKYSDDTGSSASGGDLGLIERGMMDEAFESAVYALENGAISDPPVRTPFGYHIIKLTEVKDPKVAAFEDVRDQILEETRRIQAENQFVQLAEEFSNLVYEQPDSLDAAADLLGADAKKSDWFSRSEGEGIAASPIVRTAAFSDDVLIEGLNSAALELGSDTLVAIRKADHRAREQKTLDEVRDQIIDQLASEKAREQANQAGEKLIAEATANGDWSPVLERMGLTPEELPETRSQSNSILEQGAMQMVFSAPRPENGVSSFGGGPAGDSFVVFRLDEVKDGDPAAAEPEKRSQVEAILARRGGTGMYNSYRLGLRANADVQIYEEQL